MNGNDLLTHAGITQPVDEWALDYGVYPAVILDRLARGWPAERAITRPMVTVLGQRLRADLMPRLPKVKRRVGGELFTYDGTSLTLTEWSAATGISLNTMRSRLKAGMPIGAVLTPGRRPRRTGVVADFPWPMGTGGGPIAQDFTEIEFSQ